MLEGYWTWKCEWEGCTASQSTMTQHQHHDAIVPKPTSPIGWVILSAAGSGIPVIICEEHAQKRISPADILRKTGAGF